MTSEEVNTAIPHEEDEPRKMSKKIIAIAVVIVLISASCFTVWYFYFRHWSASELSDRFVFVDGFQFSGGFDHDLAGKSVVVEGDVTSIESYETSYGTATVVELDEVGESSLVYWGTVNFELGDRIEKKVSFEWSYWNQERFVFSPQVWVSFGLAISMFTVVSAVSYTFTDGGVLMLTDDGDDLRVEVRWLGEPVRLDKVNCSLKAGRYGPMNDYVDSLGFYESNNETDSIHNLTHETGQNDAIEFDDENSDGYLDTGDYFLLKDLQRPDTETGLVTYLLRIEWPLDPDMNPRSGPCMVCYIPIRMDGAFWPMMNEIPLVRAALSPESDGKVLTFASVSGTLSWDDMTFMLSGGDLWIRWETTTANLTGATLRLENLGVQKLGALDVLANATDIEGNGIVDAGDWIEISSVEPGGWSPTTNYSLIVLYEPNGGWMIDKPFTFGSNDSPVSSLDPFDPIDGKAFTFGQVHTGFNYMYKSFDLGWDYVNISLTDGTNNISWTASSEQLDEGVGSSASFGNISLGSVAVDLHIFDLNGDGQVNSGDRIELRTPGPSGLSSSTTYKVAAWYSYLGTEICSAEFTG